VNASPKLLFSNDLLIASFILKKANSKKKKAKKLSTIDGKPNYNIAGSVAMSHTHMHSETPLSWLEMGHSPFLI
jgi:hypothetical protein